MEEILRVGSESKLSMDPRLECLFVQKTDAGMEFLFLEGIGISELVNAFAQFVSNLSEKDVDF